MNFLLAGMMCGAVALILFPVSILLHDRFKWPVKVLVALIPFLLAGEAIKQEWRGKVSHFDDGMASMKKSDYENACAAFQRALGDKGTNEVITKGLMAECYFRMDSPATDQKAMECATEIIGTDAGRGKGNLVFGWISERDSAKAPDKGQRHALRSKALEHYRLAAQAGSLSGQNRFNVLSARGENG